MLQTLAMQIMKSCNQSTFITFQAEVEVKLRDETNLVRAVVDTGLRATFTIDELKGSSLKGQEKRSTPAGATPKPDLSTKRLKFLTCTLKCVYLPGSSMCCTSLLHVMLNIFCITLVNVHPCLPVSMNFLSS